MSAQVKNRTLPRIMVAPNGARRGKADHPKLPVTIEETVETARACQKAGADGIHAHIRDAQGNHLLDPGLYRELQQELRQTVPDMFVQITTEAVGIYSPDQQRAIVEQSNPKAVSIGLSEMLSEGESATVRAFYHAQREKDVAIQHILYSADDVIRLTRLIKNGFLPDTHLQLLFVLGRYTKTQTSVPEDLDPFLPELDLLETHLSQKVDWACCAFGKHETECLIYAHQKGGKSRIGFENNLFMQDGSLANDNAARIMELVELLH